VGLNVSEDTVEDTYNPSPRLDFESVRGVLETLYVRLETTHPDWGQRRKVWEQARKDALELRGWTEEAFYLALSCFSSPPR